jgi:hypothetical protein
VIPDNGWLEKSNMKIQNAQILVQNSWIQTRKMTENGAKVMQFHSGSSNMVPLRLHLIEKTFVGSSLAG